MRHVRFTIENIPVYKLLVLSKEGEPKFVVLMRPSSVNRSYSEDRWVFKMHTHIGEIEIFYHDMDMMTSSLCFTTNVDNDDMKNLEEYFQSDSKRFKVAPVVMPKRS